MKTDEILYEAPLTQYLLQKAHIGKIPMNGTFELTPACNFDCRMCYIHQSAEEIRKSGKSMRTLEQWKNLSDEAVDAGMLYLLLTGGEPLMWKHFWELYEYLGTKGLVLSINTNGSLIDKEAIAHFRKQPPSRINITLYGASEDTYERLCRNGSGFQKVVHAIDLLQQEGILVKLNCSLTPYNVQDLPKMVKFAEDRGLILQANAYMFPPVRKMNPDAVESGRFEPEDAAYWYLERYRLQHSSERYQAMLNDLLNGRTEPMGLDESCYDPVDGSVKCRAGSASFWATWDGMILPCGMMTEPRLELADKSFNEIWNELTEKTANIRLSGICSKCDSFSICHSCAAMALAETGDFQKVPRYLCRMVDSMKKIAGKQLKSMT